MQRICIVGAGAIGGLIGARLAAAGQSEGERARARRDARSASRARLARSPRRIAARRRPRAHRIPRRARRAGSRHHRREGSRTDRRRARHRAAAGSRDDRDARHERRARGGSATASRPSGTGPSRASIPAARSAPRSPPSAWWAASCTWRRRRRSPGLVLHKMGQGLIIGEARGGKSDRVQRRRGSARERGIRRHALGRCAPRHLVQALGQPHDESRQRDDRRDRRSHPRRSARDGALPSTRCARRRQSAQSWAAPIDQSPEDRSRSPRSWARSRPRCCRTPRPAGRSSSTPSWASCMSWECAWECATPSVDAIFGLARLFGRVHGLYPRE